MLELFMLSLCFGSEMNSSVCSQAYTKWMAENPSVEDQMKLYQRTYEKTVPMGVLWAGSAAGFLYKKQIKFGITKNYYIEVRDAGYGGAGVKVDFP